MINSWTQSKSPIYYYKLFNWVLFTRLHQFDLVCKIILFIKALPETMFTIWPFNSLLTNYKNNISSEVWFNTNGNTEYRHWTLKRIRTQIHRSLVRFYQLNLKHWSCNNCCLKNMMIVTKKHLIKKGVWIPSKLISMQIVGFLL